MPSQPITSKQQHWLEHVKAADTGDESLTDYASRHDLSVKTLYQWKTKLIKLGLYSPASGFVPVHRPPSESRQSCKLVLPNGTHIEFSGALDGKAIRSIITSAGLKR